VDLEQVRAGLRFQEHVESSRGEGIDRAMAGPAERTRFIHVLAIPGNKDVPNIRTSSGDQKQVMEYLRRYNADVRNAVLSVSLDGVLILQFPFVVHYETGKNSKKSYNP